MYTYFICISSLGLGWSSQAWATSVLGLRWPTVVICIKRVARRPLLEVVQMAVIRGLIAQLVRAYG